jgi:hypothetical protein
MGKGERGGEGRRMCSGELQVRVGWEGGMNVKMG